MSKLVEEGIQVDTIVDRIKNLEEEKKQIMQSLKELQTHKSNQNKLLDIVSELRNYVQNFVNHFEEMNLMKKKEGMKQLVKQIIVDREKKIVSCALRAIPLVKQHPIFLPLFKRRTS